MMPTAPCEALAKWWSTMMYAPASGIMNSTIALFDEPSSTVCMPRSRTRSPGFAWSGFLTMPSCTPLKTVWLGCEARSRSVSSTCTGTPSSARFCGSGLV
jgi:hypothetical protein